MVEQPLNKQVEQQKETSATAPAKYLWFLKTFSDAVLSEPGCGDGVQRREAD